MCKDFRGAVSAGLAILTLSTAAHVAAVERDASVFDVDGGFSGSELSSPLSSGRWSVSIENDFFVPGGKDQDYTFGASASYTSTATKAPLAHTPLVYVDQLLGLSEGDVQRYGYEGGLYGFTPAESENEAPKIDDRPYSSLVYFSTSTERVNLTNNSVVRTQLTYGALGLAIVGNIQDQSHQLIGNDRPVGWDEQVSAGGEFTLRYAISKQRLLSQNAGRFELRDTLSGSAGYLTEASYGLSFRAGKINSSWHNFNPELASYAETSSSLKRSFSEHFFYGGFALKARAYNAFLQGQFKDSAKTFSSDELNHLIIEAWAGYTHSFINGYYLSYGLRGHTSEVEEGTADRSVVWGGIMLGKRLI